MGPAELREFIFQAGSALTATAGFAFHKYRFSTGSRVFAVVFAPGRAIRHGGGFPPLTAGKDFYTPLVPAVLSGSMTYVPNRLIKIALGMVYYFLYA